MAVSSSGRVEVRRGRRDATSRRRNRQRGGLRKVYAVSTQTEYSSDDVVVVLEGQVSRSRAKKRVEVGNGDAGGRGANGEAGTSAVMTDEAESFVTDALNALSRVLDPDLGDDIVTCGFVHDLELRRVRRTEDTMTSRDAGEDGSSISSSSRTGASGGIAASLRLVLTTPACPVKEQFAADCERMLLEMDWCDAATATVDTSATVSVNGTDASGGGQNGRPDSLRGVRHIVAVSSCKGGVGKSTVAVNLAYALRMMGARVGIFDADVYGPSLPTMTSSDEPVLGIDAETGQISPAMYEDVRLVSFGFAGQGAAVMRGPMVSGLVQQLMSSSDWGELDYLIIDMPPGTGDVQLTLCQDVPLSCAVIVTTPQKLAFVDVAKGIRMFSRLRVPCVAVVENMKYLTAPGVGSAGGDEKVYPFGEDSCGERITSDFAIQHMYELPIDQRISACGDAGTPIVNEDPSGEVASIFQNLGETVVRECARLAKARVSVAYDITTGTITVQGLDGETFAISAETARAADSSSAAIDEWTGLPSPTRAADADAATSASTMYEVTELGVVGNYAIQITYADGLNQVLPFERLAALEPRIFSTTTPTSM